MQEEVKVVFNVTEVAKQMNIFFDKIRQAHEMPPKEFFELFKVPLNQKEEFTSIESQIELSSLNRPPLSDIKQINNMILLQKMHRQTFLIALIN